MRSLALLLLLCPGGCHVLLPLDSLDPSGAPDTGFDVTGHPDAGFDLDQPDAQLLTGCATITPPPLFCDDFEGPWPPSYPLGQSGNGAAPVRTTTTAQSGNHALETAVGAGGGYSIGQVKFNPVSTGELSVRSNINVTGDPITASQWVVVLELDEPNPDFWHKTGLDIGPGHLLYLHCPAGGWGNQTGHAVQLGVWVCVELRLSFDAKAVSLWIDGKQVEACAILELPAAGYETIIFGATTNEPKARVLHDDVVLSRSPVGCP